MRAAVHRFHEILSDDALAAATHEELRRAQEAAGLLVEGRVVAPVLRPRFITGGDIARACAAASLLGSALQRLAGQALHDGTAGTDARKVLALSAVERALLQRAPVSDGVALHGRLDGFVAGTRLAFVEYNATVSCGPLTQDLLAGIYHDTPAMRAFTEEFAVWCPPAAARSADAVVHAWEVGGAPGDRPRVAICDCLPSPSPWEFAMMRRELTTRGVDAVEVSTDDFGYDRAFGLFVRDGAGRRQRITAVYRRAVLSDLIERHGMGLLEHPLVRAWSEGACVLVNTFTSHVAHKKSALALLGDPAVAGLLCAEEAEAVDTHVPWTRVVQPGPTTHRGEEVDLLPFATEHREELVLKPNDDYGGRGVVLGRSRTAEQWREDLAHAERTPHVVQEAVPLPHADYPLWQEGRTQFVRWNESTDPYLLRGAAHGCVSRLSTDALLNVGAGGAAVPLFHVLPTP
ncbi:hypothetical protein [Streptomyces sp. CC224B]|uniref:hypothetical protein n=1 Tax=Streptomyces sp. CC224B TaxID=3044571 RepID=UPI0024A8B87D|nr:hypothetical protein [Streptomyces sp. CC224B]